ncbi:hypothetical protein MAR_036679 [Mya arenaria]|uniref:Uncharacterized protein n=1 Tax=Mya arenaria TaxID=6604 RepID=A0ABY7FLT0_MYAAR|nr:hypothetical protein MAR_036679 [Mya arenaria]
MRILLIVFALGFLICLVTSRPRLPREPINVVIDGLVVISSPGYETDEYPGDTEQTWDLQAPAAKIMKNLLKVNRPVQHLRQLQLLLLRHLNQN